MIETRLLRQFIAVAEELHFNRAAQRLHMAQPPLSQAIQRLEAQVGAPLLARTNRSVTLTPAGAAFLETARRMLAALDEGVAQARRVAQGMEGHLTATFVNISPMNRCCAGCGVSARRIPPCRSRCARRPRASRSRRWNWDAPTSASCAIPASARRVCISRPC